MKKSIHFLFITFLISCIGIWGEIVELSKDNPNTTITEIREATEEERKEDVKSYFEAFEKIIYKGQGGGNSEKDQLASAIESVETPFSHVLAVYQNYCSNSLSVKTHNDQLLQTIDTPKFYILYRCSKTFLS
jgi:hypothetical protein